MGDGERLIGRVVHRVSCTALAKHARGVLNAASNVSGRAPADERTSPQAPATTSAVQQRRPSARI